MMVKSLTYVVKCTSFQDADLDIKKPALIMSVGFFMSRSLSTLRYSNCSLIIYIFRLNI